MPRLGLVAGFSLDPFNSPNVVESDRAERASVTVKICLSDISRKREWNAPIDRI